MDRLDKMHLIRYDRKSLYLSSTELGRITSYYYVSVDTMEIFKREFHIDIETGDTFEDFKESKTDAYLRDIDILKILAQAKEFQQIKYRLEVDISFLILYISLCLLGYIYIYIIQEFIYLKIQKIIKITITGTGRTKEYNEQVLGI